MLRYFVTGIELDLMVNGCETGTDRKYSGKNPEGFRLTRG